jgi:DNA-binding NtrC family response regulator
MTAPAPGQYAIGTALVVDDEPDLAWALQQNLLLDGWQVLVAPTGGDAITQARAIPLQVAFVDAKLPDMDGIEVLRRIGELQPGVTLILVSGYYYAEDQEVREAQHQGLIVHFIAKPFDLSEISALARSAVEQVRTAR